MKHGKMTWRSATRDDPCITYFIIDDERFEIEKIEVFDDGRVGYADVAREDGDTQLGDRPIPEFDDINKDPESMKSGIVCVYISEAEYRAVKRTLRPQD